MSASANLLAHWLWPCFRVCHVAGPCGRGGVMEHTAVRSTASERSGCLADAYRCLLAGSLPSQSPRDVAGAIISGVRGPVPGEGRGPAEHRRGDSSELSGISVTLAEKIASGLTSQSLPPAVAAYCVEVLTVLLRDLDLMSQLVRHFQDEDQVISHLAAKSVSACVFYQLQKSRTVSRVWEQRCAQAFHSSPPGAELDACLWSLTEVLKRLLKGAHQEILGKLLAAFDSSVSALCSKFLPEERAEDFTCNRHWGTTFCLVADLLEVLTASGSICGAGVCLKSQRMTHIHSSALLAVIGRSSAEYFAKKRALLLLKRAVLQKAGEDWALGEGQSLAGLEYEHPNSDAGALAQNVLTAVAADWLQSVQVKSASFFGGTRRDGGQRPDCAMLRAVGLLLLKSIELRVRAAARTARVESAKEVYGYLQSLWGFLTMRYGVQPTEVPHRCCWVSVLFGEQDDDMMEAAKALLSIFLHHRLCSGLDDLAALEVACASGCNPHCHFLLLLQSISFDHSTLLDFLISTEACFLEYFVRYLKYLGADWQGFTAACGRIGVPDCRLSLRPASSSALCGGDTSAPTYEGEPGQAEFSSGVQPTDATSPVGMIRSAAGPRLVEYGSSDESDPENMEVSQREPGSSVPEKSQPSAMDVKWEISGPPEPIKHKRHESLSESNAALEERPETSPPLPSSQSGRTPCPIAAAASGQVTCETSARAVLCLSELREVITRLQAKKLFPYNPSSLLKLLAQVEHCCQQSHPSHFNK
ncbi:protein Lines homolog 1 [Enoplosus armatus]|uniref:protein Lines homolog 1 n=1 Tax=Enoplosus armatus TaxID=215367 RepID=UPI00399271F7